VRMRITMLMVLTVLATSCADPDLSAAEAEGTVPASATGVVSGETQRRVAEDRTGRGISEFPTLPLDGIVYAAPTVVSATVLAVDGPFWNQADGQKWIDSGAATFAEGADYTVPVMYREVTLSIDRVERDDLAIPTEGSDLVMIALGGGETADDPDALAGGSYTVGERLVLYLSSEVFYMRDVPLVAIQPFFLSDGVYHVRTEQGAEVVVPDQLIGLYDRGDDEYSDEDIEDMLSFVRVTPDELLSRTNDARIVEKPKWEAYRVQVGAAEALVEFIMNDIGKGAGE